jgi:outer membrane lipoprotein-sorting protein
MNLPTKSLAMALGMFALIARGTAFSEETPTAQQIIERSDEVRNPRDPFQMTILLTEYVDGSARNEVTLTLYSKLAGPSGQYRNLVRYSNPPRDRGKSVLLTGTTMWFYDPASKSSIRISPEQRLVGQASQGDVVTVNFARDYAAKLIGQTGEETIRDADKTTRKCWHVELSPKDSEAIYAKAEYWVEKDTFHPVKGKFFSDSGRLLKIAYYHRYEKQLGTERPTETIIIDAVDSKLVTTMAFGGYRSRDIPESWYQRDYLPRLRTE